MLNEPSAESPSLSPPLKRRLLCENARHPRLSRALPPLRPLALALRLSGILGLQDGIFFHETVPLCELTEMPAEATRRTSPR